MKLLRQPKSFVINCRRWVNGSNNRKIRGKAKNFKGISSLLNSQGNLCCLGFNALACGATRNQIRLIATPRVLAADRGLKISKLVAEQKGIPDLVQTQVCGDLMADNDDPDISNKERRRRIRQYFARIGVRVRFSNIPKRDR